MYIRLQDKEDMECEHMIAKTVMNETVVDVIYQ